MRKKNGESVLFTIKELDVTKTEDGNFKASLCNRKKEPIGMSVYSIEKGLLKSNAILDKYGNIISNEVSIEAADMGRFVLTQKPRDFFSFTDKEEIRAFFQRIGRNFSKFGKRRINRSD